MIKKLSSDESKKSKKRSEMIDCCFGKPRVELSGGECLVDGLESIIEYSSQKIKVNLGSQEITFYGDDLRINSFTREGAIVQGNIEAMEFSA